MDLGPARADELILNNGDRLSGRILSFSKTSIRIATPHSGILDIQRRHVHRLKTDEAMMADLVSGERIIGRIASEDGSTITVSSPTLGEHRIPMASVASISAGKAGTSTADAALSPLDPHRDPLPDPALNLRGKGADTPKSAEQTGRQTADAAAPPEPIGQRPEDEEDIRRIFLRQSSVLLRPGEMELEAAANYLSNQAALTVLNARFRQFQVPLTFRVGILDRVEGTATLPFVHAEQEFSFAGESASEQSTGMGDASLGLNYELFSETALRPDIAAIFNLRAPTGETPDESGLSIGSGHWGGSLRLQFIKTVDPVVLFWGIGYSYEFPATHFYRDGVYEVTPGQSADYNFGFGFAVNDKVSLNAQVSGAYQWETTTDGDSVPGSEREPITFRSALTYRVSRKLFFEPALAIGLNDDTPDVALGLAGWHRFGD